VGFVTAPKRIQLRRTKGWRKPEGAIVVARPSKWGNPFYVPGVKPGRHDGLVHTPELGDIWVTTRQDAVDAYRRWLCLHVGPSGFTMAVEASYELRGRDLACWCPLDQPCHADVLLELANGGGR
jgi:hypothetical protein